MGRPVVRSTAITEGTRVARLAWLEWPSDDPRRLGFDQPLRSCFNAVLSNVDHQGMVAREDDGISTQPVARRSPAPVGPRALEAQLVAGVGEQLAGQRLLGQMSASKLSR